MEETKLLVVVHLLFSNEVAYIRVGYDKYLYNTTQMHPRPNKLDPKGFET
jgi:hypothetical protein